MQSIPTSIGPAEGLGSRIRLWVRAVRAPSLSAAVVPIAVGSALALVDGGLDSPDQWLIALAMLVASVLVQAGCNLGNDYYDWKRGIDDSAGSASGVIGGGPVGVIQDGSLTPAAILTGMFTAFGAATVIGIGIVVATSWHIFAIALASLVLAFLYTGGPRPLGYLALGEITVFTTMGLAMVMGAYLALTGHVSWRAFLVALPIGLLVTAILHGNNIADIDTDRAAGKITVANLLGRHRANVEFVALVSGTYVALVLLVLLNRDLWPTLVAFASVPVAAAAIRLYLTASDRAVLRRGIRVTASVHLRFGLLLSIGLVIAWLVDRFG